LIGIQAQWSVNGFAKWLIWLWFAAIHRLEQEDLL
tara:strand:- start:277 stop:381 length:105 start_codon:yes stop_codon:yes gene_type:complete